MASELLAIDELLGRAVAAGASDLHLAVGLAPVLRLDGQLVTLQGYAALAPGELEQAARQLAGLQGYQRFLEEGDLDLAYSLAGVGRFRVNLFRQRGSVGAAIRVVNTRIPGMEELGLPPVVAELAQRQRGLVLVTGPTGSGKSTTLAAMVDYINSRRACHIVTLEDPIEYLHPHKESIVNQREVGGDTKSFSVALRAALRQDPDVILVGEMRDLETMATAITAAETGHLVLATLHTASAAQTVDRTIDVFPPHQQPQVRLQLAETLQGILAQHLFRRANGRGRVAAVEVLVATPAVRNLIREGKSHQLLSTMQTGGRFGMQTMAAAVQDLLRQGLVEEQEAAVLLGQNPSITEKPPKFDPKFT